MSKYWLDSVDQGWALAAPAGTIRSIYLWKPAGSMLGSLGILFRPQVLSARTSMLLPLYLYKYTASVLVLAVYTAPGYQALPFNPLALAYTVPLLFHVYCRFFASCGRGRRKHI